MTFSTKGKKPTCYAGFFHRSTPHSSFVRLKPYPSRSAHSNPVVRLNYLNQ